MNPGRDGRTRWAPVMTQLTATRKKVFRMKPRFLDSSGLEMRALRPACQVSLPPSFPK